MGTLVLWGSPIPISLDLGMGGPFPCYTGTAAREKQQLVTAKAYNNSSLAQALLFYSVSVTLGAGGAVESNMSH
jgi:hypothetical protein